MNDKFTVSNNIPLFLLFAHLVYSHVVGLDVAKAIVAVCLIGLHAYYKHMESKILPDIRKEVENRVAKTEEKYDAKIKELVLNQEHLQKTIKNETSKYEALLTRQVKPTSEILKNVRF